MAEDKHIRLFSITDAMLAAGVATLRKRWDSLSPYDDPRDVDARELVMAIYLAMVSVKECVRAPRGVGEGDYGIE